MFSEQGLTVNYQVKETFQLFFYLVNLNRFMNISRFFKFKYLVPLLLLSFLFIKQIVIKRWTSLPFQHLSMWYIKTKKSWALINVVRIFEDALNLYQWLSFSYCSQNGKWRCLNIYVEKWFWCWGYACWFFLLVW